jgi:hypothetical protein
MSIHSFANLLIDLTILHFLYWEIGGPIEARASTTSRLQLPEKLAQRNIEDIFAYNAPAYHMMQNSRGV